MAAKIEPTKRQSAGVVAGSYAMLHKSDERLREIIKNEILQNLKGTSNQPKSAEDLRSDDNLNEQPEDLPNTNHQSKSVEDLSSAISGISERLDDKISDGVRAIQRQTKTRPSRGFARYLVAICIGVTGTLALQSYGEATKQIIAANAPELGWSPETKQMIASWVQQLGWTKPPAGPENTDAQLSVPMTLKEEPLAALQQRLGTVANDLAAVRRIVEQLSASDEKITQDIATLQTSQQNTNDLAAVRRFVEQLSARDEKITQDVATLQTSQRNISQQVTALTKAIAGAQHNSGGGIKTAPATEVSSRAAPATEGGVSAAPATENELGGSSCAARFHSYDPSTGTYQGLDGVRHPCR